MAESFEYSIRRVPYQAGDELEICSPQIVDSQHCGHYNPPFFLS